jgi:hypothetical protein
MIESLEYIISWSNENSGFLGLLIFLVTLILGWAAGLFTYFRKKPKFRLRIIENSSFGCVIDLNRKYQGYPVHKTAFAIYLEITNIGNAPSSVGRIELGYLLSDFRPKWRTSRVWLKESNSKSDFRIEFNDSEHIKVLPYLKQQNEYFNNNMDTYLEIGKIINGMVYFEDFEAWGNRMPRHNKDLKSTELLIKVKDAVGGIHKKKFTIRLVEPDEALKFSPYFAQSEHEYFKEKNKKLTENK